MICPSCASSACSAHLPSGGKISTQRLPAISTLFLRYIPTQCTFVICTQRSVNENGRPLATNFRGKRGRAREAGGGNRVHAVPPGMLLTESLCQIIRPLPAFQMDLSRCLTPSVNPATQPLPASQNINFSLSACVALLMPPQVFLHLIQSSELSCFGLPPDLVARPVYMYSFLFPSSRSQGKFFHVGAFISCSLMCIQSPETTLFVGVFYQMLNK